MLQPQGVEAMASSSPSEQLDGIGVLFGYPIKHSMSPLLHDTGFRALGLRWRYSLLESRDIDEFLAVLKDPRCYGKLHICIRLYSELMI
jgi:quinate dehydrogenase